MSVLFTYLHCYIYQYHRKAIKSGWWPYWRKYCFNIASFYKQDLILKVSSLLAVIFLFSVTNPAAAGLLTWDLEDPDTGLEVTFVYDDNTLNGIASNKDLRSITGDFGDGIFEYFFSSAGDTTGQLVYDVADLSLIKFKSSSLIASINNSASGNLLYTHAYNDLSLFNLAGVDILADWNGASNDFSALTNLNSPNLPNDSKYHPVMEPSTFAIFTLGIMGLVSRRFKKQS